VIKFSSMVVPDKDEVINKDLIIHQGREKYFFHRQHLVVRYSGQVKCSIEMIWLTTVEMYG